MSSIDLAFGEISNSTEGIRAQILSEDEKPLVVDFPLGHLVNLPGKYDRDDTSKKNRRIVFKQLDEKYEKVLLDTYQNDESYNYDGFMKKLDDIVTTVKNLIIEKPLLYGISIAGTGSKSNGRTPPGKKSGKSKDLNRLMTEEQLEESLRSSLINLPDDGKSYIFSTYLTYFVETGGSKARDTPIEDLDGKSYNILNKQLAGKDLLVFTTVKLGFWHGHTHPPSITKTCTHTLILEIKSFTGGIKSKALTSLDDKKKNALKNVFKLDNSETEDINDDELNVEHGMLVRNDENTISNILDNDD